jgi:hypothetical protein
MLIRYARISTLGPDSMLQLDGLRAAVFEKTFAEKISGADREQQGSAASLSHVRAEDTLVGIAPSTLYQHFSVGRSEPGTSL